MDIVFAQFAAFLAYGSYAQYINTNILLQLFWESWNGTHWSELLNVATGD